MAARGDAGRAGGQVVRPGECSVADREPPTRRLRGAADNHDMGSEPYTGPVEGTVDIGWKQPLPGLTFINGSI